MIAFGSVVSDEETFARCASLALEPVLEPDSVVAEYTDPATVADAYNEILDALGERDDLEALVLVGEEVREVHPELCSRVRTSFGDGDVALIMDGPVTALSPWAVRHLRFEDGADLCAAAEAAGHRALRGGLTAPRGDDGATRAGAAGVRANAQGTLDRYHDGDRPDLAALVPPTARAVLDVGCGTGSLAMAIKARQGCEAAGIELFPEAAAIARTRLDRFIEADLDALTDVPFPLAHFDVALFGDVLEHLRDPLRLLRTLRPHLTGDAHVICSLPNVKHWSVLLPLLVQDRFTYADAGLLDRTHVHFFTLAEADDLLREAGLRIEQVGTHTIPLPPAAEPLVAAAAALGADPDDARTRLEAYQYLVVARPA